VGDIVHWAKWFPNHCSRVNAKSVGLQMVSPILLSYFVCLFTYEDCLNGQEILNETLR